MPNKTSQELERNSAEKSLVMAALRQAASRSEHKPIKQELESAINDLGQGSVASLLVKTSELYGSAR